MGLIDDGDFIFEDTEEIEGIGSVDVHRIVNDKEETTGWSFSQGVCTGVAKKKGLALSKFKTAHRRAQSCKTKATKVYDQRNHTSVAQGSSRKHGRGARDNW